MSAEQTSIYGEHVARTLSRACMQPSDLREEELVILDSFFQNQMVRVMRLKSQADLAGFEAPWKLSGVAHLRRVARYPQGKSWIKLFATRVAPTDAEFADFIEAQLFAHRLGSVTPGYSGSPIWGLPGTMSSSLSPANPQWRCLERAALRLTRAHASGKSCMLLAGDFPIF